MMCLYHGLGDSQILKRRQVMGHGRWPMLDGGTNDARRCRMIAGKAAIVQLWSQRFPTVSTITFVDSQMTPRYYRMMDEENEVHGHVPQWRRRHVSMCCGTC